MGDVLLQSCVVVETVFVRLLNMKNSWWGAGLILSVAHATLVATWQCTGVSNPRNIIKYPWCKPVHVPCPTDNNDCNSKSDGWLPGPKRRHTGATSTTLSTWVATSGVVQLPAMKLLEWAVLCTLSSYYSRLLVTCPVTSVKLQIANYFWLTANSWDHV